MASSYNSDETAKAEVYVLEMAQGHQLDHDFISHYWYEHSSIADVINYYLFTFFTPSSTRNLLKDEATSLKRFDKKKIAGVNIQISDVYDKGKEEMRRYARSKCY